MYVCKFCETELPAGAGSCPECGSRSRRYVNSTGNRNFSAKAPSKVVEEYHIIRGDVLIRKCKTISEARTFKKPDESIVIKMFMTK